MKHIYSLINRKKRYFIPLYTKCNYNCIFCSAVGKSGEHKINFNLIKEEILYAKKLKYDEINIGGTEPTLYRRLPELVAFINNLNMDVGICSNGYRFTSLKYTKLFQGVELLKLKISFHSNKQEVFDLITKTPGSYKRAVRSIRNITSLLDIYPKSIKRWLIAGVVINSLNYQDLPDIVLHLNSLGVKFISLANITATGRTLKNKFLCIDLVKIKPYLVKAVAVAEKLKMIYVLEKLPVCVLNSRADNFIKYNEVTALGMKVNYCKSCRYNNSCWGLP